MLNIRVFDDSKDEDFDEKFHKKRPVQRGLISLKELNLINTVSMSLQFIINAFFSLAATFWWVISLCYSLLAKYEFFCKSFIRKQFMLYNFLNLMQMFFLQIYIYYLINPNLSFADPLLLIHFIFVLSNAMILEVARKLKGKREISKGLDTYSSRYGIKQSAYLYMSSYSITYLLFLYIFIKVGFSLIILLISFISLLVITYSTIRYVITQTKASTKIIEIVAIAYYLSMHLLLMGAALV